MDERLAAPSWTAPVPALPARERVLMLAALGAVSAVAWVYLVREARGMGSLTAMAGMMETRPRDVVDFALLFLMWAVMMVAMMVPSATPMLLLYAAAARRLVPGGRGVLQTAAFVGGYVLAWSAFSVAAAALQAGLERLALLSPTMVSASPILGGVLLAGAGLYQLSPLKEVCLRYCQAPLVFITRHWRPGPRGALRMGVIHGGYCVGCCWVLMGLLFVGGVMNLLWVAAIAAFVLLEKVAVLGHLAGRRVSGVGLIAAGLLLLTVGG